MFALIIQSLAYGPLTHSRICAEEHCILDDGLKEACGDLHSTRFAYALSKYQMRYRPEPALQKLAEAILKHRVADELNTDNPASFVYFPSNNSVRRLNLALMDTFNAELQGGAISADEQGQLASLVIEFLPTYRKQIGSEVCAELTYDALLAQIEKIVSVSKLEREGAELGQPALMRMAAKNINNGACPGAKKSQVETMARFETDFLADMVQSAMEYFASQISDDYTSFYSYVRAFIAKFGQKVNGSVCTLIQ